MTDDRPFAAARDGHEDRAAVAAIRTAKGRDPETRVMLRGPGGRRSIRPRQGGVGGLDHLLLICGHYEGVDDQIHFYIDEELSGGDHTEPGEKSRL